MINSCTLGKEKTLQQATHVWFASNNSQSPLVKLPSTNSPKPSYERTFTSSELNQLLVHLYQSTFNLMHNIAPFSYANAAMEVFLFGIFGVHFISVASQSLQHLHENWEMWLFQIKHLTHKADLSRIFPMKSFQ